MGARNAAGLQRAIGRIPELREEFWRDLRLPGTGEELNVSLEKAGRVAAEGLIGISPRHFIKKPQ